MPNLNLPPSTRIPIGFATINGQRVEVSLNPEWVRYLESLNSQVNVTTSAVGMPGAPGATGAAGAAVSFAGDGDNSIEFMPGPPGAPGATGATGPQGPAGVGALLSLIDIQDAQIEYMPGLPGLPGPQGAQGNDGAAGPAVGFLASEGDAGVEFVPGPQGPQGTQGTQGLQGASGPALGLMYLADEPTEMMTAPESTLQAVAVPGSILSSGIAGIGYTVGAGGSVTQATSKATAVVLNTPTGQITMNAASLAASTTVSFTLTNSVIAATDTLDIHRKSGGTALAYNVWVDSIAAGSAVIAVRNISAGALLEAVVLQFTVQKGSNT